MQLGIAGLPVLDLMVYDRLLDRGQVKSRKTMHGVFPAALAATASDSKSAGAGEVKEATSIDRILASIPRIEDLTPEQARALAILAAGTAILSGVLLVVYYRKRCDVTREGLKPGQSVKAKKGRRSTSSSLRKTGESSRRESKRK